MSSQLANLERILKLTHRPDGASIIQAWETIRLIREEAQRGLNKK